MYLEELLSWIRTLQPVFTEYKAGEPLREGNDVLGVSILAQKERGHCIGIGGASRSSYTKSDVRLTVRMDTPCSAQKKAMQLYRSLEHTNRINIGSHAVQMITLLYQEPQPHAFDESGLLYDIDMTILYER